MAAFSILDYLPVEIFHVGWLFQLEIVKKVLI
jgi:hypothetical protein